MQKRGKWVNGLKGGAQEERSAAGEERKMAAEAGGREREERGF